MVSGINRGDNCGLHIIYSGTVGAAREGACKGLPGIALSVDNHMARRPEDYDLSAQMAVTVIKVGEGEGAHESVVVGSCERHGRGTHWRHSMHCGLLVFVSCTCFHFHVYMSLLVHSRMCWSVWRRLQ